MQSRHIGCSHQHKVPPVTWILDSLCSLCNTEAMLCPAVTGFAPTRDSCPCYGGTGLICILRARQTPKVTPTHTKSYSA